MTSPRVWHFVYYCLGSLPDIPEKLVTGYYNLNTAIHVREAEVSFSVQLFIVTMWSKILAWAHFLLWWRGHSTENGNKSGGVDFTVHCLECGSQQQYKQRIDLHKSKLSRSKAPGLQVLALVMVPSGFWGRTFGISSVSVAEYNSRMPKRLLSKTSTNMNTASSTTAHWCIWIQAVRYNS